MKDGRANEKIFERSLLFHHHYFLFLLKLRHRFVAIRFLGIAILCYLQLVAGKRLYPINEKRSDFVATN